MEWGEFCEHCEPKLWDLAVQGRAPISKTEFMVPFPEDRDWFAAVLRRRPPPGHYRVTALNRSRKSAAALAERDRLGFTKEARAPSTFIDLTPAMLEAAPDAVEQPPKSSLPRSPALEAVQAREEARRARYEADALRSQKDIRRLRAELDADDVLHSGSERAILEALEKLAQQLKPKDQAPSWIAALAPIAAAFVQHLLESSRRQHDQLLAVLRDLRTGAAAAPGPDQVDQLGLVREQMTTFRTLVELAGELGSGQQKDTLSQIADVVKEVVRLAASNKAPAPAPVLPAPRVVMPNGNALGGDGDAVIRQRVTMFVQAMVREMQAGSDPVAVAEAIGNEFGLLPGQLRQVILDGVPETMIQALAKWIPEQLWVPLSTNIGRASGAKEWLAAFMEALGEDLEPEDDEPEDEPEPTYAQPDDDDRAG